MSTSTFNISMLVQNGFQLSIYSNPELYGFNLNLFLLVKNKSRATFSTNQKYLGLNQITNRGWRTGSYFEKGCRSEKCTRQSREVLWVVLFSAFQEYLFCARKHTSTTSRVVCSEFPAILKSRIDGEIKTTHKTCRDCRVCFFFKRDTVTSIASNIKECKNTFCSNGNLQILVHSFDKNYNASVMKLKKVLSLWYHQELKIQTWKSQLDFFKFCHRDSVPLMTPFLEIALCTFLRGRVDVSFVYLLPILFDSLAVLCCLWLGDVITLVFFYYY